VSSPTAFVTGASRGIGLAFATRFAAAGWRVHAASRTLTPALRELAARHPAAVHHHALDLTDFDAVDALAAALDEPIDLLLSNAALTGGPLGEFGHTDYARWELAHRANAMAPLKLMEAFAPHVGRSGRKLMLCVSSRLGANPFFGYLGYFASKSALNQVVKQVSIALRPQGITVVAAHPGWVQTEGTAGMGQAPLTPDDAARLLMAVIDGLDITHTGSFLEPDGSTLPLVTQQTEVKFYSKPLTAQR
jgi:NAD(P)-dependent dehydrogenase (short-subunit alcohol dehydrogenase family)